jgi:hypothetical protein
MLLMLLFILTFMLTGCQQPEIAGPPNAQGLAPVINSGMDSALANPQTDFAKYHSIVIGDLGFSRLQIVDPSDSPGRYGRISFDEQDMAVLRSEYRRKVAEALTEREGYRVVDAPAADSLVLRTELRKLEPNAPREKDEIGVVSARSKTFTKGAGSLTLEAWLIDATTGRTVAQLRDEVTDAEIWGENNPISNRAAIIRAFFSWGMGVRRQLDAFAAPAPHG